MLRWDETDRDGRRLPPSRRLHQRPHRRPPGAARLLRARRPARHPDRARRLDHDHRRPLRGQAAQQPERRGRQVGRLDLVHRSGLRHRLRLRGAQGRERDRRAATSTASIRTAASAGSSPTTSCGPTASPSRPTSAGSTSPTPAPRTSPTARATSASSTSSDDGTPVRRRRLRHLHRRLLRRVPPRRRTAGSGPAPATASTATTRTAR